MTVIALSAGAAFWRMRGRENPLVDFGVYKNPNFAAGSLVAAAAGVALFGLVYILPLFLAAHSRPELAADRRNAVCHRAPRCF
ncbi:MAG: hypothetical protein R3C42_04445 [Parvularculaceae bacterium]